MRRAEGVPGVAVAGVVVRVVGSLGLEGVGVFLLELDLVCFLFFSLGEPTARRGFACWGIEEFEVFGSETTCWAAGGYLRSINNRMQPRGPGKEKKKKRKKIFFLKKKEKKTPGVETRLAKPSVSRSLAR